MKAFVITLALAGLASAATVDAQILGSRLPTTSSASVDGWRVVGRDGNGNTIYERRTQDRYGNIVVQRARRDAKGNMSIISSQSVSNTNNRNRRNCDYTRATNSISDMIFNRSNDVSCDDVGNLDNGRWYQVGRGRDNNSIYQRRILVDGRPMIQHGRLNSDGTFTILNSRPANDNDKQWRKEQKQQEKEWKKDQKRQDKEYKKSQHDDHDDHYSNYQNGKGKGKHKGKG